MNLLPKIYHIEFSKENYLCPVDREELTIYRPFHKTSLSEMYLVPANNNKDYFQLIKIYISIPS